MIKPHALKDGDTVAVVAPSSPIKPENLEVTRSVLESLGLKPKFYPSCHLRHGHLAGPDVDRATDVNAAFADPEAKAVFCLRGGYGTPRLLEKIDYDLIRNNPKIFLGYSDITGLHVALNRQCGLITFHGPTAYSEDIFNHPGEYTQTHLKQALFNPEPLGRYAAPEGESLETLIGGVCEGEVVGGNLSLLTSALGSPYEIDTRGKILFIEEVSEFNYVIDRMLMSLDLSGKFRDCAGVLLGTWQGCTAEQGYQDKVDGSLASIFEEILYKHNKPIVNNFRAGHVSPQFTIPMGTRIRLDADKKEVTFLESATR